MVARVDADSAEAWVAIRRGLQDDPRFVMNLMDDATKTLSFECRPKRPETFVRVGHACAGSGDGRDDIVLKNDAALASWFGNRELTIFGVVSVREPYGQTHIDVACEFVIKTLGSKNDSSPTEIRFRGRGVVAGERYDGFRRLPADDGLPPFRQSTGKLERWIVRLGAGSLLNAKLDEARRQAEAWRVEAIAEYVTQLPRSRPVSEAALREGLHKELDEWGSEFRVDASPDSWILTVTSAGSDRVFGTEDDVVGTNTWRNERPTN
jgi:hypothetical protein